MKSLISNGLLIVISAISFMGKLSADVEWEISPARSSISFSVDHLILLTVDGKFRKFEGSVTSATDHCLDSSSIQVSINSGSINTGIRDRDHELTGKDFFYSEMYPHINFVSKTVKKLTDGTYRVEGDLSMRGVTKSVVFNAECGESKKLANGKTRMDVEAVMEINRYEYGLEWNELTEAGSIIAGKMVDVRLDIALLRD